MQMLEEFPSSAAMAHAAADGVSDALRKGLEARGRAALAATGGRSPGPVYDLLKDVDLDWARVVVALTDERCVPQGDPDSNLTLVKTRLLTGGAAKAHVLPLWPAPNDEALSVLLPFDAVMLGMGEDGHIASLIPGSPTLAQGLDPDGAALVRRLRQGSAHPRSRGSP